MQYPELEAARAFANKNGMVIFDPIVSLGSPDLYIHGVQHLTQLEIMFLVLASIRFEGPEAMRTLIPALYDTLIEQGLVSEKPSWVLNQKNFDLKRLATLIYNHPEIGTDEINFFIKQEETDLKIIEISNHLSMLKFKHFLSSKPGIKMIYGLVGAFHTSFLDSFGKVISKRAGVIKGAENLGRSVLYRQLTVKNKGHKVNVHVFGGEHQNLSAFEELKNYYNKNQLKEEGGGIKKVLTLSSRIFRRGPGGLQCKNIL
ncbi:MAG: hypothetical protein ACRBBP_04535 [Bdellovibrionales bacterium]